jgi:hypothetical protein
VTASVEQLRTGLDGLARAWWRVRWLHRLARAAAAIAVLLAIWAAVDWWRPLGRAGLLTWGGLAALAVVGGIGWLVWLWRRRPAPARMALLVEERCPDVDAPVSVALDPKTLASPLGGLVVEQAAAAVDRLDASQVVDPDEKRRGLLVAGLTLAGLALAGSASAPVATRAARTWQFTIAPPHVVLNVMPGDRRVVRGSPLRIVASIDGLPAGVPYAAPTLLVQGDDERAGGRFEPQADGSFAIDVPAVTRDFSYRVEAGRLVSSTYRVEALDRPSVARIDLSYVYPSFSGLEPRDEPDSGDIYAPAGTKVTVTVESTKPLTRAMLVPTDGAIAEAPLPLALTGERGGEVTFDVRSDGAYRIALVDRDALDSAGETEYFVRVMDDRPPDVRILRPAGDRGATRLEEVTIEARAEDDYGVQRLDLVYAVRGGAEKVIPLGGTGNSTAVSGRHTLYLEDLDVRPGDFITYYAKARDIGRGKRSSEARSDIFFLEVRPTAQEFMAAQSSGGMNMAGGDADDLIAAQKDVVVATWKLERRTTGGRSADDIRAVADAQAAVREKTMAQAAQSGIAPGQRRRRGAAIEPEPSPLLGAVEAMERATEQLQALRTAEAIPHEMEALNQLLKAQAEIRRRQIAQQQGGGGGGRGRSGNEDLSALFDRELLRQQGSQYEQRSNVESRAENEENPALDRIRELARRQDDLAREQQALAREQNQLPAEELKRRLDRLTREQERLRQEARQLAQQLQQQGQNASGSQSSESPQQEGAQGQQQGQQEGQQAQAGQSGQQSQSGQQGQSGQQSGGSASGQRLAEAADQMQAAASGLQNASPEEAAASGQRSLQSLRDAERAMQGALPDERRRAAGDVQLEAQALADAQRRLAEGTERLGERGQGSGAASDEQRRRLSGEQGRVAERIAQLERQVRELARAASGREDPLAQAAAELARRRLGQQLQEASRALGAADEAAERGDAIGRQQREAAGVLDRVAALAGQATGRGERGTDALSGQLANARDVRDRLRDLEARIEALAREADAQAQQGAEGQQGQQGRNGSKQGWQQAAKGGQSKASGQAQGQGGGQGQARGQGEGQGRDPMAELQRLQQEYQRELQTAQQLLQQQGSDGSGANRGGRMATPEGHEFSRSAPGTEAFKQDFARWESLRQGVASALDRYEASLAQRLAEQEAAERVTAPLRDQVPERYNESVIRYYQSLSRRPETR